MTHPQCYPQGNIKCESKLKTVEKQGVGAHSLAHSTLRGKRAC